MGCIGSTGTSTELGSEPNMQQMKDDSEGTTSDETNKPPRDLYNDTIQLDKSCLKQ